MTTALEVVKGISQVIANSYDGALDQEDKPVKVGLKREKEYKLTDRRIVDGFKVKLQGDNLVLLYHSECLTKEVHNKRLEEDIKSTISEVVKFLKREYKKATGGDTLKLKEKGKPVIKLETTSRVRCWVRALQTFKIENLDKEKGDKPGVDKAMRDWLDQGKHNVRGW